jgi:hypothetical protein
MQAFVAVKARINGLGRKDAVNNLAAANAGPDERKSRGYWHSAQTIHNQFSGRAPV